MEEIKKKEEKQDVRTRTDKRKRTLYLIVGSCLLLIALTVCGYMVFFKNSHLIVSFNTDVGTP